VSIRPGLSVSVSKQITDLGRENTISFDINQVSNSSSTSAETNQPFNSTLRETITDPNGRLISDNVTDPQTVNFFAFPGPTPDIAGKYTFTIKNIGDSLINVKIGYSIA